MTLGRFSMAHFRPGERITQIHGTSVPAPAVTGARDALAYALYHPAAALRSTEVERQSYDDICGLPRVLLAARAQRAGTDLTQAPRDDAAALELAPELAPDPLLPIADPDADAPTLFQSES